MDRPGVVDGFAEKLQEAIRRAYYQRGFPDGVVRIRVESGAVQDGQKR